MRPAILISIAAVLSFIFTGLATWYARRHGMLDHPGERHSHTISTPRGGGAGLILALFCVSLWRFLGEDGFWLGCALPGTVAISFLGWWDDHSSISARLRFGIQLTVSILLLGCAMHNGLAVGAVELGLAAIFLVWMTNLYNFMDGSNGMAGLQGVFAGAVLSVLFAGSSKPDMAMAAALIAACCVGFLPWNLGRPRVFMGDAGSLALGFALGALLIYGVASESFSLAVALLTMMLFLTDSTLTLLVRVFKGEQWYNAHKQHLYQRLIAHGWAHSQVVLFYQAINFLLVVPGILLAVKYPVIDWIVTLILALVLGLGWFLLIRRIGMLARAG